jgi:hypothetical protein
MHLSPNDRPSTHSIYHPDDDVRIPLELVGVISTVETRTPSQHELDTCKWATFANSEPWNPHSNIFKDQEHIASMDPNLPHLDRAIYSISHMPDACYMDTELTNISEAHDCLKRWGIGVETATNTLKVTTQKRI